MGHRTTSRLQSYKKYGTTCIAIVEVGQNLALSGAIVRRYNHLHGLKSDFLLGISTFRLEGDQSRLFLRHYMNMNRWRCL